MHLSGLHVLLTYQCLLECEHCFVWGSPFQSGTLTSAAIEDILDQASELGTVKWIYFEGGEPFLYYPTLLKGVQEAARRGFQVGVVSNAYWANDLQDARLALSPFDGLVQDLSISSDRFHWEAPVSRQSECALAAAAELDIPAGVISIAGLEELQASPALGKLDLGESQVMFRGRAAAKLAPRAVQRPWAGFDSCPHEDLIEPGRLHLDPGGYLHICQGICIGNLFERSLREICASYDPQAHPISGPLLAGGPAELVRVYDLPHREAYADACHLCYEARLALRQRFPELLGPDQVYGVGL